MRKYLLLRLRIARNGMSQSSRSLEEEKCEKCKEFKRYEMLIPHGNGNLLTNLIFLGRPSEK